MSETNTNDAAGAKRAPRKPDWTNKDRTISVWVEDRGGNPVANIAKKIPSQPAEYLKAYLNYKGVKLDASDIGSIVEGNSIFTESIERKRKEGSKESAGTYAGFICLEATRVEPWKSNPAKHDTIVELATVLPRYRKGTKETSKDMIGYLYAGKSFFLTVKHGETVLGELEPRDVVRLTKDPGAVIKFGDYSVTLDRFEKQEGFDTESAFLSVVKGEPVKAQLIESENESESQSQKAAASV